MLNNEWYMVVDTERKVALDYFQLPVEWREITNLQTLSEEELANIGERLETNELSLVNVNAAREFGIDADSIDIVISYCFENYLSWVRGLRDFILTQTDLYIVADRWETYDVVSKRNIVAYRTALRDLTKTSIYGEKWPCLPVELKSIQNVVLPEELRPTKKFIESLQPSTVVTTKEQKQQDQWLRIHAERERRKAGGVRITYEEKDYWFWTDEPSRTQYVLLAEMAARKQLVADFVLDNWKTMSGEFIPLTVKLLQEVIDSGVQNEKKLFLTAEQHRQVMLSADDPLAIDYTKGWPVSFEEFVPLETAQ